MPPDHAETTKTQPKLMLKPQADGTLTQAFVDEAISKTSWDLGNKV